jgi:hypothetical protein
VSKRITATSMTPGVYVADIASRHVATVTVFPVER